MLTFKDRLTDLVMDIKGFHVHHGALFVWIFEAGAGFFINRNQIHTIVFAVNLKICSLFYIFMAFFDRKIIESLYYSSLRT